MADNFERLQGADPEARLREARTRAVVAEGKLTTLRSALQEEVAQLREAGDRRQRDEAMLGAAGRPKAREFNGGKADAFREAASRLQAILYSSGEKREVPDYGELVAALRHAQEVVGAESVSVDEEVRLLAHIGEVLEPFDSEEKT